MSDKTMDRMTVNGQTYKIMDEAAREAITENIGKVVRIDTTQSLTTAQKETARSNIGAASTDTATTSANGLMSSTDKSKLNGIEDQANKTLYDTTLTQTGQAADAKVTGDEFATHKNALKEISDLLVYDILSPEKEKHTQSEHFVKGYGDGGVAEAEGWSAIDSYVAVNAGASYKIARRNNVQGAWYNSSREFVSGIINNDSGTSEPISVTAPDTAAFIRLSGKTDDIDYLGLYQNTYAEPSLSQLVHIPEMIKAKTVGITHTNYETLLPDVDDVLETSAYKMYFTIGRTDIPDNLPFDRWFSPSSVTLFTIAKDSASLPGSYAGSQQILIGENFVFHRHYTTEWQDWNSLYLEIGVGTGYGITPNFSSLTEAIVFATKYKNSIVNVYAGTFNLITEFKNLYGNDFFDNFAADTKPRGLHLTNNVTVRCSSNSIITFNYTGNNQHVMQQFSPINYLSDCALGFTLEGATVECSNCRYVVHDDPGDSSTTYHNVYKNCKFIIDNSNNEYWPSSRAIGGGLGRAGHVRIEDCICIGEDEPSVENTIVFYHVDVYSETGRSVVEMTGSYLEGGTFAALYGGNKAEYIITNNSMYGSVIIAPNSGQSESNDTNITVYEWNNVNRASNLDG